MSPFTDRKKRSMTALFIQSIGITIRNLPLVFGVMLVSYIPEYVYSVMATGGSAETYHQAWLQSAGQVLEIDWVWVALNALGAIAEAMIVLAVYVKSKNTSLNVRDLFFGVVGSAPRLILYSFTLVTGLSLLNQLYLYGHIGYVGTIVYLLAYAGLFMVFPVCLLESKGILQSIKRSFELTQGIRFRLLGFVTLFYFIYWLTIAHLPLLFADEPGLFLVTLIGYMSFLTAVLTVMSCLLYLEMTQGENALPAEIARIFD